MGDVRQIGNGNLGGQLCKICMQKHSPLVLCEHDFLIRMIERQRKSIMSLVTLHRDAVTVAKQFHKLIQDVEPFTTGLKGKADMLADVLSHAIECGHFPKEGSAEKWAKDSLTGYKKFLEDGVENAPPVHI